MPRGKCCATRDRRGGQWILVTTFAPRSGERKTVMRVAGLRYETSGIVGVKAANASRETGSFSVPLTAARLSCLPGASAQRDGSSPRRSREGAHVGDSESLAPHPDRFDVAPVAGMPASMRKSHVAKVARAPNLIVPPGCRAHFPIVLPCWVAPPTDHPPQRWDLPAAVEAHRGRTTSWRLS